jgi:porin
MACWKRVACDFATAAAQRSRRIASTRALLAALACACSLSAAAQTIEQESDRIPGLPESSIALSLPRELADPGGIRSALGREGITFHVNYIGEVLGNPTGGVQQGTFYDGRLEFALEADLERRSGGPA